MNKVKPTRNCIFCNLPDDRFIVLENHYSYAIFDKFPVTDGHTLIIPKRHFENYFDIRTEELNGVHDLLLKMRNSLLEKDSRIEAFNIGINAGDAAGQTISHCHIHLIPRIRGDVENPRGGVRNIIPGKGDY